MEKKFKILSLDGGGSWALLQLLTLKEKYGDVSGHEILKEFDLAIANSGGSIILTALVENWSLDKAISLFDEKAIREKIFSANKFRDRYFPADYLRLFKTNFGPKYSSTQKRKAFDELFSVHAKKQLDQIPSSIGLPNLKIVICTYDAFNNRAKFFKSYSTKGGTVDTVSLNKAIHGSSNAPIQYFDFPARVKSLPDGIWHELWDGALGGFNNPIAAGLIEAFKLGIPLHNINIVSIGTGNKLTSIEDKEKFYDLRTITVKERRNKLKFWRFKFQMRFFTHTVLNQAKTILYQPPDWSNYVALMFLKSQAATEESKQIVRLSPLIHIDQETKPELVPFIQDLYNLDMDLTEDTEIDLIKKCFEEWKRGDIKNQPLSFTINRDNSVTTDIGQDYFDEALSLWGEL